MLPSVGFCGLEVTRLVIGSNPFGGYSHQSDLRDEQMREYYTVERIRETWGRAADAGINTIVTNNETPHVLQAVREYLADGGPMQWVAQLNPGGRGDMPAAVRDTVEIGCRAAYFHGALVDELYRNGDEETLRSWCEVVRSHGVPVGVAAHAPDVHRWVHSLDIVDFHAVCFFNCGSLHQGKGHRFRLSDVRRAVEVIREIRKPCIAYKIMGAGRIDARMAFEYAFENIKPTDIVNVGMYRGDNDEMVEENAALVREVLAEG